MDAVKPALLALALAACTTATEPPPIPTTDGVASANVSITVVFARGNGEVAQAQVHVLANGVPADLGPSDSIVLHDASGTSRAFEPDALALGGEYEAEIATADTAIAVDFTRNGAIDRTIAVPLPPAFTLVAPASTSRSSAITITWDVAQPFPMDVLATGAPCLPPEGFTAHFEPDTGVAMIQPADLFTTSGACEITFAATRGVTARTQTRTIVFETTP